MSKTTKKESDYISQLYTDEDMNGASMADFHLARQIESLWKEIQRLNNLLTPSRITSEEKEI